jgi:hypothetical protein
MKRQKYVIIWKDNESDVERWIWQIVSAEYESVPNFMDSRVIDTGRESSYQLATTIAYRQLLGEQ